MLPRDRVHALRHVQKLQALAQRRSPARMRGAAKRPYRELYDLVPITYDQCLKAAVWESVGFNQADAVMLALQLTATRRPAPVDPLLG